MSWGAAKADGVLHCVMVCVCGEAYAKLPTRAIFPVYLLDFFFRLTCANVKALCADFLYDCTIICLHMQDCTM